ncbi:phosphohexomutase domain-containing protein [Sphingobacterium paludis]|jgi:hypothetical protein|uniref:HlyD family secretion protein n=1 Tax=Sphingobacterium paludis TaxID=1476465 RepID=A0A4R7D3G7_9SPHI|nr:hypothetical protein [Sphingobacterium paludis]TDS14852.1 hypothetical protein B0I21_103352 [Sphingobacterium paludis]
MPRLTQALESVSNEMDEIVGRIPPWIVRWGITVLFGVATISLFISGFVRFPDSIVGTVVIQAKEQPGKVTVRRESANEEYKFLVKEGDRVKPGDTLLLRIEKSENKISPVTTPMTGSIYRVSSRNTDGLLEETIWVVPIATGFHMKINYPNKGAGNVQPGQQVRIALHDYPDAEYGFLDGIIESILPIQTDDKHQATISLIHNKLLTSRGREIPILPLMEGSGEILLNEKSIFYRIFGSILQ